MAMLGRHEMSAARLRTKIAERFDEDLAESVCARLLELELLDDETYAERYVERRFERGGYGGARIERELRDRGVARATAAEAVARLVDAEAERERARLWLDRFFASARRDRGSEKDRAAAFRRLVSRGYGSDLVCDLLGHSR